jgi:hypothetical protein
MSTSDLIAFERRRYLASAHTRLDWFHYICAVERLRSQPQQPEPPLAPSGSRNPFRDELYRSER